MKRIAIVIGHTAAAPGARAVQGFYEYEFNTEIAKYMVGELAKNVNLLPTIWTRDHMTIKGTYKRLQAFRPDIGVELHFNSFNTVANGCEMLHLNGSTASKRLAQCFQDAVLDLAHQYNYFLQDRGLKSISKGDRGYTSLIGLNCPQIITEPCFGDNHNDSRILNHPHHLALTYVKAINAYFSL